MYYSPVVKLRFHLFCWFIFFIAFSHTAFADGIQDIQDKIKAHLEGIKGAECMILRLNVPKELKVSEGLNIVSMIEQGDRLHVIVAVGDKNYDIDVQYAEVIEMPVLTKSVKRGDVISEEHLTTAKLFKKRMPASAIADQSAIIGRSAKKNINRNVPITDNDIGLAPIIRKGQRVKLRFHKENLVIETVGIAMEDGSINEMVKLQNAESGKTVTGKVKSSEIVEVGR